MVTPTRVTAALDKPTVDLLEKLSKETHVSQSEIIRRAIKFFSENKALEDSATRKKVHAYLDLLLGGEHVILDVDHWLLFLRLISSSSEQEKFWSEHKEVARAHWEQLKTTVNTVEDLLLRLEMCNFYRLIKNADNDFTLVLVSEDSKDFIRTFLQEYFSAMAVQAEIKENLTKLRVTFKKP